MARTPGRLAVIDGSGPKVERCQTVDRRERTKANGEVFVHLEPCNRRAEYDDQCAHHYIVFLHALLHEREQHVAELTSMMLRMRRKLYTEGPNAAKMRGGSVSTTFAGNGSSDGKG